MCLGMSDHRKQRYIVLAIELMKTLGSFAHHLTVPLTRVWTVKAGDKRLLRSRGQSLCVLTSVAVRHR
jgi:hypothetical protein